MKTLHTYIFLISILVVTFSCTKEQGGEQSTVPVQFSFEQKQLKSTNTTSTGSPTAIVITIEDLSGNAIYSNEQIVLYNLNGSYISSPISLVPGTYQLTGFMVTDKNNNVLYLTPKAGSAKAYLVTNPLPVNFMVTKNSVSRVIPEVVIAAGSTPQDFGYATFSFNVIKTFSFLMGVFDYDKNTHNLEMTTAHIKITADSGWVYEKDIVAATDTIAVKDNQSLYFLSVTKSGYDTWTNTLTAGQLKLYGKSANKGPLKVVLVKSNSHQKTVTDIDGNVYHTVKIGHQVWMAENLKTTRYNDGTTIPLVTNAAAWSNLTTAGYCWYNNDSATYKNTYGALYNWYTINTGKLCPTGWHVPKDVEWQTLINYLGGDHFAGGKLKEIDTTHWISPNTGATNEFGFTALPGGDRSTDGLFESIGYNGYWWSATENNSGYAWLWALNYSSITVFWGLNNKELGNAVRCVRD